MAKYAARINGDVNAFCAYMKESILDGSMSASFEDEFEVERGGVRCVTQVYERYSMFGSNRVSLSLTVIGHEGWLDVCAITSGGSEAILFKLNTVGEQSFLETAQHAIEEYRRSSC